MEASEPPFNTLEENVAVLADYSARILAQAARRRERVIAFEALLARLGAPDFLSMGRLVGLSRRRIYTLRDGGEILPEELALIERFIAERERGDAGDPDDDGGDSA